jgi:hypothetical protein
MSGEPGVFLASASFANLQVPRRKEAPQWRATLAQLVEQLIRNQQVVGSNPTGGSKEIKQNQRFYCDQHRHEIAHLAGLSAKCPHLSRDTGCECLHDSGN